MMNNIYNINNINNIKSTLNVYNAQDLNTNDNRQQIHIEITVTNACNMNCKYCFEHDHKNNSNRLEEKKQLNLIKELCDNFDILKFNNLQIVFWGGEPLLNIKFLYEIINITYKYNFVTYFMYSNGTLVDLYQNFISNNIVQQIKHRFRIQLSYDGEPINTIERGNTYNSIINVARMLKENGFSFSFKATASAKTFKYIPDAWKSYEKLYEEFGDSISYALTIDMTSTEFDKYIIDWKNAVLSIMQYEYWFFKNHKRFLMSWLNYKNYNDNKSICCKDYSCHLHTDGNIYICHGCPYIKNNKYILETTKNIKSLYNILTKHQYGTRNNECFDCEAVFCNICHIYHVDANNIYNTWLSSMNNNKARCQCFKYFGMMKKILDFILINKSIKL